MIQTAIFQLRRLLICVLLGASFHSEAQNFSNKGKEFWVGYGHNQLFSLASNLNAQDMVLYLSADQLAHVTVSIAGTAWVKNYTITAGTAIPSDLIPKSGDFDCRLQTEGLSDRGIHIVSDVPIVAYAHVYGVNSSGAAMLLPVESYGYTYYSLNSEQNYDQGCYSWFYIVASDDNTTVRITPSRPTVGGKAQKVPFEVNLNKGQIYNVMGATIAGPAAYDLSGSKVQSIPGPDGFCHPIGVFSGSSRTLICDPDLFSGGGDFIMQQVFPVSAWGTRYLTALTSSSLSPSQLNNNKIRVYVNDPTTQVRRNGLLLTGLTNNSFYEVVTSTSDYITANKPVMVAQFIPSSTGCSTSGLGDPEMFYLSPMEQAINNVVFYNTDKENISVNYLTLVIPQGGMASLKVDGGSAVDYTYPHPNLPGYRVVVKQLPAQAGQHTVSSDSGFTAITYGLGNVESYGYNAGTYINDLTTMPVLKNSYSPVPNTYTCPGTPFRISMETIYQPVTMTWYFSRVSNITPSRDTAIVNPVPDSSFQLNGKTWSVYNLPMDIVAGGTGTYNIPVGITDPHIDNCSQSEQVIVPVPVQPGPEADFTLPMVCLGDTARFTGSSPDEPNIQTWAWDFGDGTVDSVRQPSKLYAAAGDYPVRLRIIRSTDGCFGEAAQTFTIHPGPRIDAGPDKNIAPGHSVLLEGSATDPFTTVSWTPSFGLSADNVLQPLASPSASQLYYLTVTDDKNCHSRDSVLVRIFKELHIPNAFSPNGDGANDRWVIPSLSDYQHADVQIYNRWGQLVFHSTGYNNPWDGTMNGRPLQAGAYFYIISPNDNGYNKLSGSVMLLR